MDFLLFYAWNFSLILNQLGLKLQYLQFMAHSAIYSLNLATLFNPLGHEDELMNTI